MADDGTVHPIRALQRIASFHYDAVREGHCVCSHCGYPWPCPTYQQVEPFVGEFRRAQREQLALAREWTEAERQLRAAHHPAARVEARAVMAAVLGVELRKLWSYDAPLGEEQRECYRQQIRRLAEGAPLNAVLTDLGSAS